jgi:hypothetical protein
MAANFTRFRLNVPFTHGFPVVLPDAPDGSESLLGQTTTLAPFKGLHIPT